MILHLPPLRGPGRKFKPRGDSIIDHVTQRQIELSEQHDDIITVTVLLRTIAAARREQLGQYRTGDAKHLALAKRIDRRVSMLLSVDWDLQRGKELIDEHLSDKQGRSADLSGVGDLPS